MIDLGEIHTQDVLIDASEYDQLVAILHEGL
jgi:hypothetical protein